MRSTNRSAGGMAELRPYTEGFCGDIEEGAEVFYKNQKVTATSTKPPSISVVMVDGSFRESFHSIGFFGKQTIAADDYELLWIEYHDKINPNLADKIRKFPNMRIIKLGREGLYHSSYCFNAGIRASKGELIVIPDGDVVVEEDFLETVWRDHGENDKLAMYLHRFNEPKEKHIPNIRIEHLREVGVLTNPINYGSCLSVRKKWLLEINGYEQHSIFGSGYHANGLDVYTRLKNLGLHIKWHPQLKLYHPWHPFTLTDADSYRVQHIIIEYRARNLMTVPFNGIDSVTDFDIPRNLEDKIYHERKRLADRQRRVFQNFSFHGRNLINRIRSHL